MWSTHVVHYILGTEDGFPPPQIGTNTIVYCIFLFVYNLQKTPLQSFRKLLIGHLERIPAYIGIDEQDNIIMHWQRAGVLQIQIFALSSFFTSYLRPNMVVFNINGGPHFTYLRQVSETSFTRAKLSTQC